jgi:hypothetical protein
MDMIKQENLGNTPLFVIANLVEGRLLSKAISKREGESVLGRAINFTVHDDAGMQVAANAGLPLSEVGCGGMAKRLAHMMLSILAAKPSRVAA